MSRTWGERIASVTLAVAILVPHEAWAQGCAMCRTALSDPNDPTTRAFNSSILLLMAAPYTLATVVGGWLVYSYWRANGGQLPPALHRFMPSRKESVQ